MGHGEIHEVHISSKMLLCYFVFDPKTSCHHLCVGLWTLTALQVFLTAPLGHPASLHLGWHRLSWCGRVYFVCNSVSWKCKMRSNHVKQQIILWWVLKIMRLESYLCLGTCLFPRLYEFCQLVHRALCIKVLNHQSCHLRGECLLPKKNQMPYEKNNNL